MAKSTAKTTSGKRPGAAAGDAVDRGRDAIQGPTFSRLNYLLLGGALATILVGFVLLSRGSITLAPVLLVAGYLVLVPMALLKR